MISYREKEMMMVMKYIADHSDEFADQIMEAKDKMGAEENLNSLFNRLQIFQTMQHWLIM